VAEMSEELFYYENIEESVKVEIPDVDRARSYTYHGVLHSYSYINILNCISVKDKFYENDSTKGKLQQLYSKNQFTVCKEKCMHDVPETSISLREKAFAYPKL